ncbi:MAG: APC family permease [Chitinophagaceae bacterium]|nr:APC family permease [Chitinophagaceae bacterium]
MTKHHKLGFFSFTMIVIGLVIGMGIFRTSRDAAQAAANPWLFFMAWIAGGMIAICGALTYAEIGSRYPVTGGYYKIFSYAYHPSLAFGINSIILISNAASLSGVSLIGSEYISHLLFNTNTAFRWQPLIAIACILLFYGVNLMGLKMSAQVQNVLMVIKIGLLLAIISALLMPHIHAPDAFLYHKKEFTSGSLLLSLGLALKATSFTYGGYQQTINFGEEVNHPQKTIPRSIFAGIIVIITLYLLASLAYVKVIGFEALKETTGIASVVAEKMFGQTGKILSSVLLFFGVLAYVNVLLLSNPRVMYAMSADGVLPRIFQKKHPRRDVLTVSLSVFTAISVAVIYFAKDFERILSFVMFLDSIGMATSAATLFILRKRTRHLDHTGIYILKPYPLLPLIFITAYVFIAAVIAIHQWQYAVTGAAVLAACTALYFVITSWKKNKS